jgi:hypothetical protein
MKTITRLSAQYDARHPHDGRTVPSKPARTWADDVMADFYPALFQVRKMNRKERARLVKDIPRV